MAPKGPPPARARPIGCFLRLRRGEARFTTLSPTLSQGRGSERGTQFRGPQHQRSSPGARTTELIDALLQLGHLARERANVASRRHAEPGDGALHAVLEDLLELGDGIHGAGAGFV